MLEAREPNSRPDSGSTAAPTRTFAPGSPSVPETALRCRRCDYDLGGQRSDDGRYTCPECGLSGTLAELVHEPNITMSRRRQLLLMVGPSAACFVLFVLTMNFLEGLALIGLVFGVLYAIFAPGIITLSVIDDRASPVTFFVTFVSGTVIGWIANILTVIAIWIIILPLSPL